MAQVKEKVNRTALYNLLEGEGKAADHYGRLMTVFIIISLLPLCFKEPPAWLIVLEWICAIIFIIDYIARWSTADHKLNMGLVSFLIYPFTPMAIVDLLSILPVFIALNPAFRTLRALRLLRVLRAFRLIRYSKGFNAIRAAFLKQKDALGVVLALAIGYVFVSALIMFNVEPDTFEDFFDALYWAVVSLTTVGYGDLYPSSDIGRAVAMVSSLMGIAVVALPAGIITAGLLDEISDKRTRE